MNDVAIAEQAIQVLHDRLHSATRLSHENLADKQRLSYAAFVDNDPSATADLEKLRHRGVELASTVDGIKAAIAEADRRLAQAREAVGHETAKQHFKKLHEQLSALEEMAEPLDMCLGKMVAGQMGGKKYEPGLANPPLLLATGDKLASVVQELTALGLDRGVKWPPGRWDRAHVADLRIELQAFVEHFGRLPAPSGRNFAGLIGVLVASIKAALAQHEQTNNAGRVAA